MVSWVIIALVILGIFLLAKVSHIRHKTFIFFVFIVILLALGAILIVNSNNDINLNSVDGVMTTGKLYLGWLGNGFQNLKTLTGKAVDMDWKSTNGTFINKTK